DGELGIAVALRGAAERGRRGTDRRLPAPSDLQLLEIGLVDLVERRIARAHGIAVQIAPLAGLRGYGETRLRTLRGQNRRSCDGQGKREHRAGKFQSRSSHLSSIQVAAPKRHSRK